MENFTQQLIPCMDALERYVRFRIQPCDADDVLQDVLVSALQGYPSLRDHSLFKPWLLGIARHKCADYLRRKYRNYVLSVDAIEAYCFTPPRFSFRHESLVMDTLDKLSKQDQQILWLFYFQGLPQHDIAVMLKLPIGTVKSRLHHARARFRAAWPAPQKGEHSMHTIMPDKLPHYTITPSPLPPFECRWEEMMGWFIVPRLGEKLSWAMYDFPDRIRTEADELKVTGRAMVHGVEGVEITVRTFDPMENNQTGDSTAYVQRSFVAQLTDTHCRILSETHEKGGVKYVWTFLDGDEFLNNWGFGENNCGNEIHLRQKGDILRTGSTIQTADKSFLLDVVGRYTVEINGKSYDTICVMDVETYSENASEQFIDQNGRTILWRRFNPDRWQFEHYGKTWSEMLPDSETLIINGKTYVHWYDCITSYIL